MKIYNIKGEVVDQHNYNILGNGRINLYWDGNDKWGNPAASGIYLILIDTGEEKIRGKFAFIK